MKDINKKLEDIFEGAKSIRPEASFVARSKSMLFSAPARTSIWEIIRRGITEPLTFGVTLALASVLLLFLFGGVAPWSAGDQKNRELLSEAEQLNFQIQLNEAQYYTESADEVAAYLGELKKSDTNPNPIAPSIF